MGALLYAAAVYSVFMALALPTLLPRLYEPRSRRPEALRLTWAIASCLPLAAAEPATIALAAAAALLAHRGRRWPASLAALLAAAVTLVNHMVCYK